MSVHDVAMDHPGARGHHLFDLRAQPREVRGQDRGRDPQLAQTARVPAVNYTALNMLP